MAWLGRVVRVGYLQRHYLSVATWSLLSVPASSMSGQNQPLFRMKRGTSQKAGIFSAHPWWRTCSPRLTLAGRHDLLHNNCAFRVKCPFFNHGEGEKSNYCTFILFSLRMFDLVTFYLLVPTVLTKANNLVAVGLLGPGLVVWSSGLAEQAKFFLVTHKMSRVLR